MNELKDFVTWARSQGASRIKAEGFADGSDLVKIEVEFRDPTREETVQAQIKQVDSEFSSMLKDMPEDERKIFEQKRLDSLLYGSA